MNKQGSRRLLEKHRGTTIFGYFQRVTWHMKLPPILWEVETQADRQASCLSTDRVLFSEFQSKGTSQKKRGATRGTPF